MSDDSKTGTYRPGNTTSFLENGKHSATKGLVVLIPIFVTLIMVNWMLNMAATIPGTQILEITPYFHINQAIKIAVLSVIGVFFVTGLGNFLETRRGLKIEKMIDRVFQSIPLLRSVYKTSKITADTVLGDTEDFGKPVKIKMGKMEITGFKTGNINEDGKNLVFVPTSPNITSGFVVEIEDQWIHQTDESVADALTKVLSAGFGAKAGPAQIASKQQQL